MAHSLYDTWLWRTTAARARKRDGSVCTVARLLGGECSHGTLHVHHIRPVSEGGAKFDLDNLATACASHHPMWEALRRRILGALDRETERPVPVRCRHNHRSADARAACEARMARERQRLIAA